MQIRALLAYCLLTLVLTWPVMTGLTSHLAGFGGDPWQTMWRFEDQAAKIWSANFWSEFFGGGEPRLINYSPLPWMPLQLFLGQPLTYNVVWLLSFILSGYGMFLLVSYLTKNQLAAFLAGLVYMFAPYHVAHALGHFGAMQLQWLPLAILAWLHFLRRPCLLTSFSLSLVIIVQSLSEHHYALWLGLFFVLYSLYFREQIRERFSLTTMKYAAVIFFLIFFFVVLPYWPTMRLAAQNNSSLELGIDQTIRFSADPLSYVIPASFHSLWGPLATTLFRKNIPGNVAESTQYLGLFTLLMVIFYRHFIPRRQFLFWATVATIFFVISLGPRLHILGYTPRIPLPYSLVDSWPLFSSIRAIGRAGVMVNVAMVILFGWVVATQIKRRWIGGLLACLLVLDFLFMPFPRQSSVVSPAYAAVTQLPGRRIVELPAATNYTASSRALYASLIHGKEVIGSIALERAQDGALAREIRSLPALRQLVYLATGQLRLDRPDFFDQQLPETLSDTLRWLDVGAIIIHPDSLSVLQWSAVRSFLENDLHLVPVVFNDVTMYAVSNELMQLGDGLFVARDSRWERVGFDQKSQSTFAEIPTEAGITVYNVNDSSQRAQLRFSIAQESHGSMLFMGETGTEQIAAKAGDLVVLDIELAPHSRQSYAFRNQLPQKIIIQNPSIIKNMEYVQP